MTVFYENSTRTRVLFEVAGKDERRCHQRQRVEFVGG